MPYDLKLVTVGDQATGKTCLFIAYAKNTFPETYVPTVFENYVEDDMVCGTPVSVCLWDTHGTSEEQNFLRPLSYPLTDVFLVCFSIDNRESLANVKVKWVPELRRFCPNTPIVLAACKVDLRDKPTADLVTREEGSKFASDLGLCYIETSARTQQGVKDGFHTAIREALLKATTTTIQPWFSCGNRKRIPPPPVMPSAGMAPKIEVETSRFADDWLAMHENPVHADVTFILRGQLNLDAHTIVLCSSSTYFRRVFGMMRSHMRKRTKSASNFTMYEMNSEQIAGIVAVYGKDELTKDTQRKGHRHTVVELSPDIKPKTFVKILQFLYSGVPTLANDQDQIDPEELDDIINLAATFELPKLTEICQNCLAGQAFLNPSIGTSMTDETRRNMKDLYFNTPETADVTFNVEGRNIYAHKSVLTARCKNMAVTIQDSCVKDQSSLLEIDIQATTSECFLALLEYLYTDQAPIEQTDVISLIVLADKYGLKRLTNLCELHITKEVNKSVIKTIEKADIDVIGLLQSSQDYNAEQLSRWCLHFISTNYTAFKNRVELSSLNEENRTFIEANQWPPLSYIRDVEEYERKWKIRHRRFSSKCSIM
ncbi:rho-related protein racA-like [Ylistrum balloti]|uniref:rho-related protein racA-like n=1 Tax=Ylistrum balloti TaxID=509963 RepID=UPI002905901E|nr:rho-related protein racA-like [Ylistrum balloti]